MLKRLYNFLFGAPVPRRTEGYNFAKGYAGSITDLENYVVASKDFGTFDDFDRGIDDFLKEAA